MQPELTHSLPSCAILIEMKLELGEDDEGNVILTMFLTSFNILEKDEISKGNHKSKVEESERKVK